MKPSPAPVARHQQVAGLSFGHVALTAALAAWLITGAIRDWIRSLDDAELGRIE